MPSRLINKTLIVESHDITKNIRDQCCVSEEVLILSFCDHAVASERQLFIPITATEGLDIFLFNKTRIRKIRVLVQVSAMGLWRPALNEL
jgi:hypothetical protein